MQIECAPVQFGGLDITDYRDDNARRTSESDGSTIDFDVTGKIVVLVDDVLYTGRTVNAAMTAISNFGRPAAIQLAVYRLAWAEIAGVPLDQVRAAFHYVGSEETVRPSDLLDHDGLLHLIQSVPIVHE